MAIRNLSKSARPHWLPDWKLESEYPTRDTKRRQLAWEFLRRNPHYQADYARLMAQPYYQWQKEIIHVPGKGLVFPKSPEPPLPEIYMHQIASKYGFAGGAVYDPADPHAYSHPQFVLDGYATEFMASSALEHVFEGIGELLNQPDELSRQMLKSHLKSLKAIHKRRDAELHRRPFVRFDLERPFTPQLEKAWRLLTSLREERKQPVEQRKPRKGNFRDYLRILDARTCGAPYAEIAAVIYPTHPDCPASDLVKKNHIAAKKLRDNDYLFIA